MRALKAKTGALSRIQGLPGTAVGEHILTAAAASGHVPAVSHSYWLAEIERDRPAGNGGRAAVGNRDIHLIRSASGVGRRCRAGVRGKCLAAQQYAGQKQA